MTTTKRELLKPKFGNGERPSGTDFSDLLDSFLNLSSDGVSVDADGNLVLSRGVSLGNSNATTAGSLRFSTGQVQFFDGANWVGLTTGGAGAFQTLGATNTVAYTGTGTVGIGNSFTVAAPPQVRLDVALGDSATATERARFGNVVCCNGSGTFATAAMVSHQTHATATNFALMQLPTGALQINAPSNQPVSFRQNGTSIRFGISASGNVIVGGQSELSGTAGQILQVAGKTFKNDTSATWDIPSDARLKDNVRDLEAGLAELHKIRPVRFRYNGRAGTQAGLEGVGIIGQEIEAILPETIQRLESQVVGEPSIEDLRIFNPSALTYVLINAVKELAGRVERLEQSLVEATAKSNSRSSSRKSSEAS